MEMRSIGWPLSITGRWRSRHSVISAMHSSLVCSVMGFNDASFQSLYHFTTGDPRLTTLPPYGLKY